MHRILVIVLVFAGIRLHAQTPLEIVEQMFSKTENLKGFIAVINKTERFEEDYSIQLSLVKLNRNPYKIYVRQLAPKEGVEVLVNGQTTKKAVVNLNSFPWVNLYLDPQGILMRKNQHHLIFDSGFDLMVKILKHELGNSPSTQTLSKNPDIFWNGRTMYHLELINKDYSIIDYKVQKGENVDSIAEQFNVNAYSIIELNRSVSSYSDVSEGQIIKVPNHYAKSMSLYVDKETMLPLVIKVFDHKGLYEKYEYNSISIDPLFAENEFTEDFEHYNF